MACEVSAPSIAKLLAFSEIALSVSNFVALSFNVILIIFSPETLFNLVQENPEANKDLKKFLELQKPVQIATLLLLLLLCVIGFGLGLLLLNGSKDRNAVQLRAWRMATAAIYMLCIPIYIMWLVYTEDVVTLVVSFILIYFFGGFSFYVVHILIYEIDIRYAEELNVLLSSRTYLHNTI